MGAAEQQVEATAAFVADTCGVKKEARRAFRLGALSVLRLARLAANASIWVKFTRGSYIPPY
jgi:hypothetical protein